MINQIQECRAVINQIQECRAVINQIQECRAVINRALPSLHGESLQITNSPFNLSLNMFFYSKQNVFFMKVEHCNIKILHFCEKFAKEMCSVHRPSSLIKLILNPSEKTIWFLRTSKHRRMRITQHFTV